MSKPFKRILLTGAAGGLGKVLRDRIKPWADVVRLSDLADLGEAREGEEIVQCDLADKAAVMKMMEGVDAVLHFGGISVEAPFDAILSANIVGTANLYEAVHKHGVRRVVFASSNHAIGFYKQTEVIDADDPVRPDTMYGVSKCFGENLSRYYFDRFGIETVCIRIGSSFPEPQSARMLVTYFSYDDLVESLRCSLMTAKVGHTILFGMSDNPAKWWDNRKAGHLGFVAKDSSTKFNGMFPPSGNYPAADDVGATYQGGPFILNGPQFG
ncbi:NAD-dependent epimerase/dehydratase family protein [Massilia cavernae]|uniref:NAD(P)-dependent oxidoreductase n=1 Tax=Massilia cavernae TaxID=2320864 RepID=A0A418XPT0_9BURK|nr:NAD(P)-dependent oxidoreductase [Massilia cavernae]RJG14454.1 NAD(P)-dependent oxidoreductase [Massilia cavernae]